MKNRQKLEEFRVFGGGMGSLISPELGLDCRFSPKPFVQRPIGRFLSDVAKIHCESDRILKLDDYANRLREEMKKIDAFKRELPLCMLLISDGAIRFFFSFLFFVPF